MSRKTRLKLQYISFIEYRNKKRLTNLAENGYNTKNIFLKLNWGSIFKKCSKKLICNIFITCFLVLNIIVLHADQYKSITYL